MTTRRQFLVGCSTLAAAAGLNPAALLTAPLGISEVELDQISLADFSEHVKTAFRVRPKSAPAVALELVEAQPAPISHGRTLAGKESGLEKFSLLFRGPRGQALGQDTHTFEHPQIGRFALFIVPVLSADTTHTYYEAIFNRSLGPVGSIRGEPGHHA